MPIVGVLNSKKATLQAEDGKPIELQFNPSECVFSKNVGYSSSEKEVTESSSSSKPAIWTTPAASLQKPELQYTGREENTFNLTLYFDTSGSGIVDGTFKDATSVKEKTDAIEQLAKIDPKKHRPPKVTFTWGDVKFTGWITSVQTAFTLFTPEGKPIRAKMELSLNDADSEKNALQSPDRTKSRVLSEDVSLWSLAKTEYGDINEWRRIAKANNIRNPFDIETGTILEVPAIVEEE